MQRLRPQMYQDMTLVVEERSLDAEPRIEQRLREFVQDKVEPSLRDRLRGDSQKDIHAHVVAAMEKFRPQLGPLLQMIEKHPGLVQQVTELAGSQGGLLAKLGLIAADAGGALTFAKIGAIGGPLGVAISVAVGFVLMRVRRRLKKLEGRSIGAGIANFPRLFSPSPDDPSVPSPTVVGGGTQTETRFVTVPVVDQAAESLREAMRREVSVNPNAADIIARVMDVADKILKGRKALGRTQPATGEKQGMKND